MGTAAITWVIEPEVFDHADASLRAAARSSGHDLVLWNDEWWSTRRWPALRDRFAIFHGSLDNARRVRAECGWTPGAFCDVDAFNCSAWYPRAREWLLNRDWRLASVRALCEDPREVLAALGDPSRVFVRPDSPLKPFSGRVLEATALTLRALDHGIYFDDPELPVIVAPARTVGREWRFVIVAGEIVAGSAYSAATRDGRGDPVADAPRQFAAAAAARLAPPELVYVMDVCESDDELRLLELNPFSGADLYACDGAAIVAAVARLT